MLYVTEWHDVCAWSVDFHLAWKGEGTRPQINSS